MHSHGMSRYYFHVYGHRITRDDTGSDLPDESAAIEWAKREILFQASQSIKKSASIALGDRIVIEDNSGRSIAEVAFGEVISVTH